MNKVFVFCMEVGSQNPGPSGLNDTFYSLRFSFLKNSFVKKVFEIFAKNDFSIDFVIQNEITF